MHLIMIKQQDLLRDSKNISDSIAYFKRVCMICLIFPSASQLALISALQARAELNAFEYENKESRESNNNHTKRLNWSSFEEAPYRNHDMSQQP